MKTAELRKKKIEELYELLKKKKNEIEGIAQDILTGKEKNIKKKKGLKKEFAQMQTIITEKKALKEIGKDE